MASSTHPLLQLVTASAVSHFLPPLIVRTILNLAYSRTPLRPDPRHARWLHYLIVSLYILYTVWSSYLRLPVDYYDLLGVAVPSSSGVASTTTTATDAWKESVLRPRWLSLVKAYHPDKLGGSEAAQAHFRTLQRANEVLRTDQLRTAYERFGPEYVERLPQTPLSERDILVRGALSSVGWYTVALVIFIGLPLLGGGRNNKLFWRLTTLILLASHELALLASPQTIYSLRPTSLHLLTYELVAMLRQVWFGFNLALSHLPILSSLDSPSANAGGSSEALISQIAPLVGGLGVRSGISSSTLDRMLRSRVSPGDDQRLDRIVEEMARL